jgi:hypothetical protein
MKIMKIKKSIYIILAGLMLTQSCNQDILKLEEPLTPVDTSCEDATKGSADFSKFVAIGNSFVAGFQAGALFTEGQNNSLPFILSKQFQCVEESAFNQPDINSLNGYNIQQSIPGVINLGRIILFDPDGPTGPRTASPYPSGFPGSSVTCPSAVTTPALPSPYNTADAPGAYTGDKSKLNNFGVPFIFLGQALIKETGGPPTANPYFSPFYARFASTPGTSTILGDALGASGSFYLVWLGFDDVLLYAATGADGSYPLTNETDFDDQYSTAIGTMLVANPAFKGVVGNIPNFTSLPYFYTVTWNNITLDAATASTLTTNLANNYNGFLDAMVANSIITLEEKNKRKLTFAAGKNGILLTDEDLTDLSPYMTGDAAGLIPYAKARQATSTDLVPLAAGAVLGTCYMGSPSAVFGVSYPVADKYILTPVETTTIVARTAAFNASISATVAGSSNRLALADVNKAYADLVAAKAMVINGITISPSFAPPTGIFSEDGIHPNSRGYAFTANVFIDAINAKFTSTIPKVNIAIYNGTGLPINP